MRKSVRGMIGLLIFLCLWQLADAAGHLNRPWHEGRVDQFELAGQLPQAQEDQQPDDATDGFTHLSSLR